ncbi:iron chelate uptake ABC transporter family permease subunit [Psychromonas sp. KJ10-10]|uniref:iron chelate uptake ABC transporter family permease subunit n=1 Tax=Psychromonas sp. KJ10-10 TaxID=3391823 RepID=UPI0039B69684
MTDNSKILLLVILILIFAGYLLGHGLTADNYEYFLSKRTPKIIAIILAGVAIALSSFSFQTITHNRILTPSIMGFDSLYLLTQVLIVLIAGGLSIVSMDPYLNFILCVVVMLMFSLTLFHFYFASKRSDIIVLLLLGVVLSQLFSNVANMLIMMLDPSEFAIVQTNMFASFTNVKTELVFLCIPIITLTAIALFKMSNTLNILWLDKDNATSLGVDVAKVTKRVLLLSSLLIAVSTAMVGPVLFLGLLVTNLTREWLNTFRHNTLFIACMLVSVLALLSGQFIVEFVFQLQTTLSVVINFVGGFYFLRMLLKNKIV